MFKVESYLFQTISVISASISSCLVFVFKDELSDNTLLVALSISLLVCLVLLMIADLKIVNSSLVYASLIFFSITSTVLAITQLPNLYKILSSPLFRLIV